jgi:hypothetical protein
MGCCEDYFGANSRRRSGQRQKIKAVDVIIKKKEPLKQRTPKRGGGMLD